MDLATFIRRMPKVELHVHLEGTVRPKTLLNLAQAHRVALPVSSLEEMQTWYTFRDFPHFGQVYGALSACLQTPDDIERIACEFLADQAAQHILYSEVTYTAYAHYAGRGISFADQLAAINRARDWSRQQLGVDMQIILDISRDTTPDEGMIVAEWAIESRGNGVVALGLGGPEAGNPPSKFAAAFARAKEAGVPLVLHAGETVGAWSIWEALQHGSQRIGHGVRCVEDAALLRELAARQTPLEVCLSSNVCLGVVPSLRDHPLPTLLNEGLYVTLNSDDPSLFHTTLTDEYLHAAQAFQLDRTTIEQLVLNAAEAALLAPSERAALLARVRTECAALQ